MTKLSHTPGTDQEVRLLAVMRRSAAIYRARAQAQADIQARAAPRHRVDQRIPKPTLTIFEDDCRFAAHGVSP